MGKQERPAVSVIVPCYRVTAYIADTLNSLRAQTFRDFETIVINDGCPDTANLEAALQPYQGEIVYLKQQNRGLAAARNTALAAARAPLIALLDGDDVWEPEYLAEQVSFLQSHPECDAVYPNARMFGENAWAGRLFMDQFPSRGEVTFRSVLDKRCSIYVAVTAKRDKIEQVGGFEGELRAAEDLDLWLRMLHAGARFAYHTKVLVRQRLRRHSLSDDQTRMARAVLSLYGKLMATLELDDADRQALVDAIDQVNAEINLLCARRALYDRNREQALEQFKSANKIMKSKRLLAATYLLRLAPELLYAYVHRRFGAKESYVR